MQERNYNADDCIDNPKSVFTVLTPKEAEFLKYLIENKNIVLKRETILEDLWGENDYFLGRSMDVFVTRLRKYLKPELSVSLDTIRGVGFILRVN